MEQAIQVFAAVSFLVIGLSHLAQPRAWVAFYQALAAQGTAGVFLEGFLCLSFGAIIVAFHNAWHGPALLQFVLACRRSTRWNPRLIVAAPGFFVSIQQVARCRRGPLKCYT